MQFDESFWTNWFNGNLPDAIAIPQFGFWTHTTKLWQAQGHLAPGEDPCLKVNFQHQLVQYPQCPLFLGMLPGFEVRVLSREDDTVTFVDNTGVLQRANWKDFEATGGCAENAGRANSMSHWLQHPVKDMRSWKELFEKRFRPDVQERLLPDWKSTLETAANQTHNIAEIEKGMVSHFPFFGTYGMIRQLVGAEPLLYMFYDDAPLIRTILADMLSFWRTLWGAFLDQYGPVISRVHFFEDMCYKTGPLISPGLFREFLSPVYAEVIDFFKQYGLNIFSVDTDGNAMSLIPELVRCGVNYLLPLEVQAGMDVGVIRDAFGELFLLGGIDKRVLNQGPAEIDAELKRRFATAYDKGRYWPAPDHGLPPAPWENWLYFAERYKHYCSSRP